MKNPPEGGRGLSRVLGLRLTLVVLALAAGALFLVITRSGDARRSAVPDSVSTSHLSWCESTNDRSSCLPRTCNGHSRSIVYAGAGWCHWCQKLHNETFADGRVQHRLSRMGLVHVDVDAAEDVARAFHVRSLPTIIVLGADCRERGRFEGFRDADAFLRELDRIH